jgi:predicted permease
MPMTTTGRGAPATAATPATSRRRYAAVGVVSLAVALGLSIAVLALVEELYLGPLGLPAVDRTVELAMDLPELGGEVPFSAALYLALDQRQRGFAELAAVRAGERTLTGAGDPQRIEVASVTPSFFRLAGAVPLHGRPLQDSDAKAAELTGALFADGPYVVLSESLWRTRFGADEAVIGRLLDLDGVGHEVVGVMPRRLAFPPGADAWAPLAFAPHAVADYGGFYFRLLGRPVGSGDPDAELRRVAAELRPATPGLTDDLGFVARPLRESLIGDRRTPLLLLSLLALVIVVAVTVNTAQLHLAQAIDRRRELAVRLALGSTPGRLCGRLLADSARLTSAALVLGLALAWTLLLAARRAAPLGSGVPFDAGLDRGSALAAALIALAATAAIGLLPAFTLARGTLVDHLRESSTRSTPPRSHRAIERTMTAVQVGLALVLVTSGVLLATNFVRLRSTDLGFEPHGLLTLDLDMPPQSFGPERLRSFVSRGVAELAALPGADSAAALLRLPVVEAGGGIWYRVEGEPAGEATLAATFVPATPGAFRTLGQPLLAGRGFEQADRAGGEPVAIIDETFARRHFPGGDALGRHLTLTPWPEERRRIAGVVATVPYDGLETGEALPAVYVPYDQLPFGRVRFVVRSPRADAGLVTAARERLWKLEPAVGFDAAGTFDGRLAGHLAPDRWALRLVLVLSGVGLLLAATCVYASTAQQVSRRWHELAIRASLGASPPALVGWVTRTRLPDVAAGVLLGLAAMLALGRFAETLLARVESADPWLLAAGTAIVTSIAAAALHLSARRAARADPTDLMR